VGKVLLATKSDVLLLDGTFGPGYLQQGKGQNFLKWFQMAITLSKVMASKRSK
jgi:hypothetical protein